MLHKSVLQERLTRVSHKSVLQECSTRASHKNVLEECHTHKCSAHEYHTEVLHKSVLQECSQECHTRVSSKSVLQERLCDKTTQDALAEIFSHTIHMRCCWLMQRLDHYQTCRNSLFADLLELFAVDRQHDPAVHLSYSVHFSAKKIKDTMQPEMRSLFGICSAVFMSA